MQRKLMLILNPQAGKKESRIRLFELVDLFSRHDCTVTVCPTLKKHDATRYVAEMGDHYDLILCCGGDGTLNEVITGMMPMENRPDVGYIPAGTTNDMAASLHLPKQLLKAASAILQGNIHMHDIGEFKDRYFVYVAAFGAFTNVTYLTSQPAKNAFGFLAYIFEGIRRLPEIKPYRMVVEHDGECLKGDFVFGAITNSTSMGGIKNPVPGDVKLDDGLFEVLLVRNPTTPKHFRKIVRDLGRKKYKNENVVFFQSKEISFFADNPLPWVLDGEAGGSHQDVTIKNLPKSIRFLAGKP